MTSHEQVLLHQLKKRSVFSAKPGEKFTLASGDKSDFYIDLGLSSMNAETAQLIGEVIYYRTKHLSLDAMGGLASGAVPVATAAIISYAFRTKAMNGFWVRDEKKGHGTGKLIEGPVKKGDRVLVLEDVITRGGSALKAVNALRELGCHVSGVLALVDRQQGGEAFLHDNGVESFQAVFTLADLGVTPG